MAMELTGDSVPLNPSIQTAAGTKSRWFTETTALRPTEAQSTARSDAGESAIRSAWKKSRWSDWRPNKTLTFRPAAPQTTHSNAGDPAIGSHHTPIVPTAGAATHPGWRSAKKPWTTFSVEFLISALICLALGGLLLGVGIWQLSVGKAKWKEAEALKLSEGSGSIKASALQKEAAPSLDRGLIITVWGGGLMLPSVITFGDIVWVLVTRRKTAP